MPNSLSTKQFDMTTLVQQEAGGFDPSQFRLQPDGTFRITMRAMAAWAGVDNGGLSRSLRSAADENPLPCARSLDAAGFGPADVATWGETGGIPEDAAILILNHYGMEAAVTSGKARLALLSFARVGINAYLKEKVGAARVAQSAPMLSEASEMMLILREMPAALQAAFPSVDANLLGNAVVEGMARQWPGHRPLLEPVKLALAPTMEEAHVTVTELAREYASRGHLPPLRDIVEGSAWSLKRKEPAAMMNELLLRAGLQVRIEGDSTRKYEPTSLGKDFAVVKLTTAKDANHQVQQVRWKVDSTLDLLEGWIDSNHRAA